MTAEPPFDYEQGIADCERTATPHRCQCCGKWDTLLKIATGHELCEACVRGIDDVFAKEMNL